MLNALKQSGAKATNSFKKRFDNSLIRMTCFYGATLIVILFISGTVTYSEFSSRIGHRFLGFPPILLVKQTLMNQPTAEDVRQDLVQSLIFVNGILLLLACIFSYWLARRTLQPIKDAYERQRRFLGDASHELRTPLSILHIELENELATTIKSTDREGIESKLEEVKRMTKLVNDLLTLSRLDEDRFEYKQNLKTVDLSVSISNITKRLQPLAESNNLKLIAVSPTESIKATLDEELLSHAVTNFILNAILYNKPEGSVTVSVNLDPKNKGYFVIEVTDTGIGMAPEDLKNIFERFYRADKSRSRRTGGSGLGLSIAQSAIGYMNGTLSIESELHKGTKVLIKLPLAPNSSQ